MVKQRGASEVGNMAASQDHFMASQARLTKLQVNKNPAIWSLRAFAAQRGLYRSGEEFFERALCTTTVQGDDPSTRLAD